MQQKSIILEMEEAKQELIQCINEIIQKHGLNCYLMEPTFAELYTALRAEAQRELAQARAMQGAAMSAPNSETMQND